MASKYVENAKEGAEGKDHTHMHKHTQGRKVQEDGDRSKETHGMKPHTAPPANTHTLSLQGMTTNQEETIHTGPAGIPSFDTVVTAGFTPQQRWLRFSTGYRRCDKQEKCGTS